MEKKVIETTCVARNDHATRSAKKSIKSETSRAHGWPFKLNFWWLLKLIECALDVSTILSPLKDRQSSGQTTNRTFTISTGPTVTLIRGIKFRKCPEFINFNLPVFLKKKRREFQKCPEFINFNLSVFF